MIILHSISNVCKYNKLFTTPFIHINKYSFSQKLKTDTSKLVSPLNVKCCFLEVLQELE